MYSISYLLELRSQFINCDVCDDLQNELSKIFPNINYESHLDDEPMIDIDNSLNKYGFCFIGLADSQYNTIIQHYFTLFKTYDGIFRLESYSDWKGKIYGPRLVEWPTYKCDILYLLTLSPGEKRITYWNGLFNSREDKDGNSAMIIDVNFKTYNL
jgi:hypothetical protein